MKKTGIISVFLLAFVSMNAQEHFNNIQNSPSHGERINQFYDELSTIDNTLSKDFFMKIDEPKFLFRNSVIINNIYYPLFNNKQNRVSLIVYSESFTYIFLGNIENIGAGLQWDLSKNISLDGGFFISRQYGYTLYSNHTVYGINLKFNYNINSKILFNLNGQYIVNQNKDPFMLYSPILPHTGISANLEYRVNPNIKFSLEAGIKESIFERKKYEFNIEGKTSITF